MSRLTTTGRRFPKRKEAKRQVRAVTLTLSSNSYDILLLQMYIYISILTKTANTAVALACWLFLIHLTLNSFDHGPKPVELQPHEPWWRARWTSRPRKPQVTKGYHYLPLFIYFNHSTHSILYMHAWRRVYNSSDNDARCMLLGATMHGNHQCACCY